MAVVSGGVDGQNLWLALDQGVEVMAVLGGAGVDGQSLWLALDLTLDCKSLRRTRLRST